MGLGKNQAQDFDAHIASTTLCMIQYSILTVVKRFQDYETLGDLFREVTRDTLKVTLYEHIYLIIINVVNRIALFLM